MMPEVGIYEAAERATKHEYDYKTNTWRKSQVTIRVNWSPWQEGSMRKVFLLKDLTSKQDCVAKISKDQYEHHDTYFEDVKMSALCKRLATDFNKMHPPKKTDFVIPSVMWLQTSNVWALVEPRLQGRYEKHSNNYGFVSPEDRNTPQAFSHFSWCQSRGKLLVCDIQGVADIYTDPQIHSNEGPQVFKYGKGDLGIEGINQFFATHRCNAVCEFMNLPASFARKGDEVYPPEPPHPNFNNGWDHPAWDAWENQQTGWDAPHQPTLPCCDANPTPPYTPWEPYMDAQPTDGQVVKGRRRGGSNGRHSNSDSGGSGGSASDEASSDSSNNGRKGKRRSRTPLRAIHHDVNIHNNSGAQTSRMWRETRKSTHLAPPNSARGKSSSPYGWSNVPHATPTYF